MIGLDEKAKPVIVKLASPEFSAVISPFCREGCMFESCLFYFIFLRCVI
jgi:hypothetical protein